MSRWCVLLQAVRSAQSVLSSQKNAIIGELAPAKKVRAAIPQHT